MRLATLSLLALVLGTGALRADPPARLGLPLGSGDASTPTVLPIAPSPGVLGAPTTPDRLPAIAPGSGLPPGMPTHPFAEAPQPGYPLSFPSMPGALPAGGRPMPMGPGAMHPMPGATPPGPMDSGPTVYGTGPCGPIRDCLQPKELTEHPFFDNLSFFFGVDSAHEPLDLGVNTRFGYRFHINWGLPLVEDWNLGLHLGAGYNFGYNTARIISPLTGRNADDQTFFTLGVFQRMTSGLNWEIAWDFRNDDYYEQVNTSQWRGLVSYNVVHEEIGVWGTLRDRTDRAHLGPLWFNIRSINQVNLFWKHTWDNNIVTGLSVGMADEHGRFSLVNPTAGSIQHPFLFGADLFVPLSDRLALFGEALFLTPNDSGTVIATLGLAWYPSGRPADQPRGAFNPLLPAASGASMPLDVQR